MCALLSLFTSRVSRVSQTPLKHEQLEKSPTIYSPQHHFFATKGKLFVQKSNTIQSTKIDKCNGVSKLQHPLNCTVFLSRVRWHQGVFLFTFLRVFYRWHTYANPKAQKLQMDVWTEFPWEEKGNMWYNLHYTTRFLDKSYSSFKSLKALANT